MSRCLMFRDAPVCDLADVAVPSCGRPQQSCCVCVSSFAATVTSDRSLASLLCSFIRFHRSYQCCVEAGMWRMSTRIQYAIFATFLLVVLGLSAFIIAQAASTKTTKTPHGFDQPQPRFVVAKGIQGYMIGLSVAQGGIFRGIPFSQAPKGEFRWKNPRQPVSFEGNVWNATYNRPGCPQSCTYKSKNFTCPDKTDEDCLYLNVWVPKSVFSVAAGNRINNESHYVISEKYKIADEESLAVIVYLHGGNYVSGAGSALLYDGRFLAEQGNVIFVTTNYRLGALGFLVQGQGSDAALGNFGTWDQIYALNWVRNNIKFFGGNPNKVTLFGQSSGAQSVGVLMTSKHSRSLFQRAILSSDPLSLPFRDFSGAQQYGAKFASAVGCQPNNMTCLRGADVDKIVQASKVGGWSLFGTGKKLFAIQPWGPVVDGDFLEETPLLAFQRGKAAKIPVIMGVTTDEGMFFVPLAITFPLSTIFYKIGVGVLVGSQSADVLDKYPTTCQSNCDNRYNLGSIVTDYVFTCPSRKALSRATEDAWFYLFDQPLPFTDLWESDMCDSRVCHCADLPFIFGNVGLSHLKFSEKDTMLAKRMGFYWTNFAKYGNPNGSGEFKNKSDSREERFQGMYNSNYWPPFSDSAYGNYTAVKFKSEGDTTISDPYQDICDFWDGLNSYGAYR